MENQLIKNFAGISAVHISKPKLIAFTIASILSTQAVQAEETLQKSESEEEVIVWGTQIESSSFALGEQDIAIRQADHISDLLRILPGIDVGGSHTLNQRITIRSMEDKDLRISIDGANQNTYMFHHMGNLQIHADILNSVSLEVGTNSVINGGLAGSIRFETKSAEELLRKDEKFGARVQIGYGDNSGNSYSFTGYGQLTESLDFLAYHNVVNKDNFEAGDGEIINDAGELVPGATGKILGKEGDISDSLIKLGWDISYNHRLEFGYETYKDEGDYATRPDMGLAVDIVITGATNTPLLYPTEFTRDTYTLNYDGLWGEHTSVQASLFANESELYRDYTLERPSRAGHRYGKADNKGLNIIVETLVGEHTLTYGTDIIKFETDYERVNLNGTNPMASEEATNTALFFQDRFNITDKFTVIPGVRYDIYDLDTHLTDETFDDFSFALAAEYQFTENFLVKLSSTELFKGPEVAEVYIGAGINDIENLGIKAETGTNNEFSFAYATELFGEDDLNLGATFFRTEIKNYIYDYADQPTTSEEWKDNIGDMTVDGFEAYVSYTMGNLSSLLTYSDSNSELDAFDDYQEFDKARLDRQQGDTVSLNFDYELAEMNLTLHYDIQHVKDVSTGPELGGASLDNSKQGFTVHNLSARWLVSTVEGLTLTAGVDNVFDEFYASQSSRTGVSNHRRFGEIYRTDLEPGRNAKVTLAYEF